MIVLTANADTDSNIAVGCLLTAIAGTDSNIAVDWLLTAKNNRDNVGTDMSTVTNTTVLKVKAEISVQTLAATFICRSYIMFILYRAQRRNKPRHFRRLHT